MNRSMDDPYLPEMVKNNLDAGGMVFPNQDGRLQWDTASLQVPVNLAVQQAQMNAIIQQLQFPLYIVDNLESTAFQNDVIRGLRASSIQSWISAACKSYFSRFYDVHIADVAAEVLFDNYERPKLLKDFVDDSYGKLAERSSAALNLLDSFNWISSVLMPPITPPVKTRLWHFEQSLIWNQSNSKPSPRKINTAFYPKKNTARSTTKTGGSITPPYQKPAKTVDLTGLLNDYSGYLQKASNFNSSDAASAPGGSLAGGGYDNTLLSTWPSDLPILTFVCGSFGLEGEVANTKTQTASSKTNQAARMAPLTTTSPTRAAPGPSSPTQSAATPSSGAGGSNSAAGGDATNFAAAPNTQPILASTHHTFVIPNHWLVLFQCWRSAILILQQISELLYLLVQHKNVSFDQIIADIVPHTITRMASVSAAKVSATSSTTAPPLLSSAQGTSGYNQDHLMFLLIQKLEMIGILGKIIEIHRRFDSPVDLNNALISFDIVNASANRLIDDFVQLIPSVAKSGGGTVPPPPSASASSSAAPNVQITNAYQIPPFLRDIMISYGSGQFPIPQTASNNVDSGDSDTAGAAAGTRATPRYTPWVTDPGVFHVVPLNLQLTLATLWTATSVLWSKAINAFRYMNNMNQMLLGPNALNTNEFFKELNTHFACTVVNQLLPAIRSDENSSGGISDQQQQRLYARSLQPGRYSQNLRIGQEVWNPLVMQIFDASMVVDQAGTLENTSDFSAGAHLRSILLGGDTNLAAFGSGRIVTDVQKTVDTLLAHVQVPLCCFGMLVEPMTHSLLERLIQSTTATTTTTLKKRAFSEIQATFYGFIVQLWLGVTLLGFQLEMRPIHVASAKHDHDSSSPWARWLGNLCVRHLDPANQLHTKDTTAILVPVDAGRVLSLPLSDGILKMTSFVGMMTGDGGGGSGSGGDTPVDIPPADTVLERNEQALSKLSALIRTLVDSPAKKSDLAALNRSVLERNTTLMNTLSRFAGYLFKVVGEISRNPELVEHGKKMESAEIPRMIAGFIRETRTNK